MLAFVALRRGTWAAFKFICSTFVAILLLLWFLYARHRRRFRGHTSERGSSLRGRNAANVRLVEVKTEHPDDAPLPVKSKHDLQAILDAEANLGLCESLKEIEDPCPAEAHVIAEDPTMAQGHLDAADPFLAEDPSKADDSAKAADLHVEEVRIENRQWGSQKLEELIADGITDFSKQLSDGSTTGTVGNEVTFSHQGSWLEDLNIRRQDSPGGSWREDVRPKAIDVKGCGKHSSGSSKAGLRVHFDNRVHCRPVPQLAMLSQERKAAYWWQPDDFAEFLKVRIEIGKAYRQAARKLGVDIMKLSSVGTHSKEGYKTMIQQMPELANESRRGLGLGRKRQRAKNRDEYIAAVLKEQKRQRDLAAESGKWEPVDGVPYLPDPTHLAKVAERVSKRDRDYSHSLATTYLKQARELSAEDSQVGVDGTNYLKLFVADLRDLTSDGDTEQRPLTPHPAGDQPDVMREASYSEELRDDTTAPCSPETPKDAPHKSSKGFGLSRDHLAQKGLSATGHYISRHQKQRSTSLDLSAVGSLSDDSDGDFTTDADDTDADASLSGADGSDLDDAPRPPRMRRGKYNSH